MVGATRRPEEAHIPAAAERAERTRRRAVTTYGLAGLAVLVVLTSACVAGEAPPDTTSGAEGGPAPTTTPAATFPPETRLPETTVSTAPPTTTEALAEAPSTTDPAPVTTVPIPGEPSDFGPTEGAVLAVVGVDHDDMLNVRDVPAGEIIATMGLLNPYVGLLEVREAPSGVILASPESWADAIVATGRTRALPTTTWNELRVAGLTGWSSAAYLAQLGATDDVTAHIIEILGERPQTDTMLDLGFIVADALASDEPPSRMVVSVAPFVFEAIGEVTIDVLNIGDDSVLGFRLGIFADAGDDWMSENPGPFTLRSVVSTVLCYPSRGVTEDGLCN